MVILIKNNRYKLLSELKHEVYNAEDMIDGCYNPDDKEVSEFVEINTRYRQLLKDMNKLVEHLDNIS